MTQPPVKSLLRIVVAETSTSGTLHCLRSLKGAVPDLVRSRKATGHRSFDEIPTGKTTRVSICPPSEAQSFQKSRIAERVHSEAQALVAPSESRLENGWTCEEGASARHSWDGPNP